MDGLGGLPAQTFKLLKTILEAKDQAVRNEVILAQIEGIRTHEDRIQQVLELFRAVQDRAKREGIKIFLVGQSAGGSAVRIAASRLKGQKELAGVILLSQAMPRGIVFMTMPLAKAMWAKVRSVLFGEVIHTTEEQYGSLIEPIPVTEWADAVLNRQPLSGPESRDLALWFNTPALQSYECPTLDIWGELDQWISATAHRKLYGLLRKLCRDVSYMEVPGSGHLTLASSQKYEVIRKIMEWTSKL